MKMNKFYFLFFILLLPILLKSQSQCNSIFGQYICNNLGVYSEIFLKTDSTFILKKNRGMYNYEEKGNYLIKLDTLFLYLKERTLLFSVKNTYFLNSINEDYIPTTYKQIQGLSKDNKLIYKISWCNYNATDWLQQKCGQWFFFNEKEELIRIEKYKKNKLRKIKNIK